MKKRITKLFPSGTIALTLIISSLIFLCTSSQVSSQVSYNMSLIKNMTHTGATPYSALWGYVAPNGREYAIVGCYTGTIFYDVTDTLDIREVGFVPCPNPSSGGNIYREMKTYSHYAYIVSEADSSSIQIVDLVNLPTSIRYVGRKTFPGYNRSHTISQNGPYLYMNGNNPEFGQGTTILDLSVDPENPIVRGRWDELYIHDCTIQRDTIYACNIGDNKISIIDATNKNNLFTIKTFPTTPVGSPHNCAVTSDRKYLYSTDETTDGKLKVWNIQNIQEPILVKRFIPPPFFNTDVIHNVEISGNYLILAYYSAGVLVLDISNPADPKLAGFYDTSVPSAIGCWAVYRLPSGKIIASDIDRGLFVLRLKTQTEHPVADFASFSSVVVLNPLKLFNLSSGFPTSNNWTITGPQNFTSTDASPEIIFNTPGTYTVKLKVSNSMGSDSITEVNYLTVTYPPFSQFSFQMPLTFTINTDPSDTSKFKFIWSKTGTNAFFNYKLKIKKINGTVERTIASENNGRDTAISIRKSYLDSLGREFGFTRDSILCSARVYAYNGRDSTVSSNVLVITIRTDVVGINNISTAIPDEYKLHHNYPNPFNPATKIKFDLRSAGFTILNIYDINGREIVKLINEKLSAGTYEYQFDAASLPSGVYFYKLESQEFSSVKKMLLIK